MPVTPVLTDFGAGAYAGVDAVTPDKPTFISNDTSQITIGITEGTNSSSVEYAIYVIEDSSPIGFVTQSDGSVRSEVDDTLDIEADWNNYATWTSQVTVTGLTQTKEYKFKVKARSALLVETAYSALSDIMISKIDLVTGPNSTAYTLEVTTGNTKATSFTSSGTYGAIEFTYSLLNKSDTASRVVIEFYDTDTSAWVACTNKTYGDATTQIDVTKSSNTVTYTWDGTGTDPDFSSNNLGVGDYIIIGGTAFNVANRGTFAITDVADNYFKITNAAGVVESNIVIGAADAFKGGEGLTALTTSTAGTSHQFIWNSYTDLGNSFNGTADVRITPYDTSPTGGDAGDTSEVTVTINNLPTQVTLTEIHGWTWDEDTTPVFTAVMGAVRGGTALYFILYVKNTSGTVLEYHSSGEVLTGWDYETTTDNWVACGGSGVPVAYADGVNRIRYTFQVGLTQGTTYSFELAQAEVRNVV